jgi:RNA recognition motif-containing protein
MITNIRVAVKLNRHHNEDASVKHGVVEYTAPEAANLAVASEVSLKGIGLEKEIVKARDPKEKGRSGPKHRSKVYVGNLPAEAEEGFFVPIFTEENKPMNVFLAKSSDRDRKYAFLEFKDEAERNRALGTLEEARRQGMMAEDVIVSPAYPSYPGARKKRSPKTPVKDN